MFSNQNDIKLEIYNRRKFRIFANMCKLNITFLYNQWDKEKLNYTSLRLMKNKIQNSKIYRI